MAKITLDSRYSRADIKIDENNTRYIDWFGDIKFDVSSFEDNVEHIVRQGDSVFSVASEYYGSQRYYWVVCRSNVIFNPFKKLIAGESLILPSAKTFNTEILQEN